jgi:glycosyltransferase involved in cell wall biosynthesis
MAANPRYLWRDDVPSAAVRRLLAQSHAMVISSLSEGGANVVSEAAVAGVPILASRIDGNVGLLGRDYPGYFPVGNTKALARLLRRVESEPGFMTELEWATKRCARRFRPALEIRAWRRLLEGLPRPVKARRPRSPVRSAAKAARRPS